MLRSSRWSHSLRYPHLNHVSPIHSPICSTCPIHLILDLNTPIIVFSEEYRSESSSLHNLLLYVLSQMQISSSASYSTTLSLFFYLSVTDKVSCSYKTPDKGTVLRILIFILSDNRLVDKRCRTQW
jgi:hypothetical protein